MKKRTPLFRNTPSTSQTTLMRHSPMSQGLAGKLSRLSHLLLKNHTRSRRQSHRNRPASETAAFRHVAMLPCACCGIAGYSQAAHSNRYQDGKGTGIKAHYLATFPLCCSRPGIVGCHVDHDQCIGMTRDEADARTKRYIADTLQKLGVPQ